LSPNITDLRTRVRIFRAESLHPKLAALRAILFKESLLKMFYVKEFLLKEFLFLFKELFS